MAWTDERIDHLKKMWEEGLTASQIAEKLGGVSRNAVIGKAHRLGLKSRPSPVKAKSKKPKTAKLVAKPKKAAAKTGKKPQKEEHVARRAMPPPTARTHAAQQSKMRKHDGPKIVSVGPGGFLRQGPGDQQAPIPPAPPRRLVPAKPSEDIADKTGLLDLNDRICRWPMNHPGEPGTSISAAQRLIRAFPIASSIAGGRFRRNCRAAQDALPHRCHLAARESGSLSNYGAYWWEAA